MRHAASPPSLRLFSAVSLALFAIVVLVPLATVLWLSIRVDGRFSLAAWSHTLLDTRQWALLRNSLVIAAGTALAATLLGAPAGFALEYIRIPGRRIFAALVAVPFLIPSYVSAIAWIDLLGTRGIVSIIADAIPGSNAAIPTPYHVGGVILVQALSLYPLVALASALAIRRFDRKMEEAADLAAGGLRAFAAVTFPLLAPGILAGSLFVFLLSLVAFAVPSLLQVAVYPVEVYTRFNSFYDVSGAATQAVPLMLCGLAAFLLWLGAIRPKYLRLATVPCEKASTRPRSIRVRAAFTGLCILLLALSVALPLGVLARRAWPLDSLFEAWQTAKGEIAASALVAVCGAFLLVALGFATAYLTRARMRGWGISALSVPAFLVSGPVLGVALIAFWNHDGIRAAVYDSIAVMILACAGRFMFFAHHGIAIAMRDVHRRWEEAATLAGVSWGRQVTGLFLPYMAPALLGAWALAFLLCMTELDATVLVCPPGATTLPIRLFTLMHYGPDRLVAALSLILVFMILIGAALLAAACHRVRKIRNARG